MAALQVSSLKGNQESYVRSQAAMLAADMLDRMRANQAGFRAGQYDMAATQAASTGRVRPAPCRRRYAAWQGTIDRLLPGSDADAAGRVVRNSKIVTITIRWREREEQSTARTYDPANAAHIPDAIGDLTMLIDSARSDTPALNARAGSASSS